MPRQFINLSQKYNFYVDIRFLNIEFVKTFIQQTYEKKCDDTINQTIRNNKHYKASIKSVASLYEFNKTVKLRFQPYIQ